MWDLLEYYLECDFRQKDVNEKWSSVGCSKLLGKSQMPDNDDNNNNK